MLISFEKITLEGDHISLIFSPKQTLKTILQILQQS